MPLPASWVDHLFAKLSVRYGAAFLRQWPDADPALVKADWAEVLEGFDGASLAYALRYLPTERPPNALQFRDICRRAPVAEAPKIEHDAPRADPERVARIVAKLAEPIADDMTPAQRVAANLRERQKRGERLTSAQLSMLQACELRGEVKSDPGMFTPIPVECLPPAMREEETA